MKHSRHHHQNVACIGNGIESCILRSFLIRAVNLLLLCLVLLGVTFRAEADIPTLAWPSRSDWVNVKTVYGATGNGGTDDTAAIQTALNAMTDGSTLYFPAGTYRVSSTLVLRNPGYRPTGYTIVGQGASTVFAWYGASGGTFMSNPGCVISRFIGLKFDGRGIAAVGMDNNNVYFDTESRWQHVAFYNFTTSGLQTNPSAKLFLAEPTIENCVFNNCGSGIKITKYNDYDFTITGCDFVNCGYGINNLKGNFYARDCYFQGSVTADIASTGAEHGCSVRRCVSTGSAQFINYSSSVSPLDVQDCYVSGWTGSNGAISHTSAPLVLHNNNFVSPPDTVAPVRCPAGSFQRVLVCNNAAPQSAALLSSNPTIYTIPAGSYGRNIAANGGTITSFVNSAVSVPSVVFDVKSYGALGNGVADDTAAIQQAINAARNYGQGAIAYVPKGNYLITSTLTISGANYVVGGCGYMSRLIWRGESGGTMVSVSSPRNVRLENIMVGHGDSGTMTNSVDILQTGTGSSFMTYSGVWVYGCYEKQAETKGLLLSGLGSGNVVVLNNVQGNLRVMNSARATILGSTSFEGGVVVDDSTSSVRDGFLGFMTRLSTLNLCPITVRNNNSLVMSDYYTEQGDGGPCISGVAGNPSGRITICGPKTQYKQSSTANFMSIDNYQGSIYYGSNQFYVYPSTMSVVHTGTRALDFVLMGSTFYNANFSFTTSGSAVFYAIGNIKCGSGVAPADNYTVQTLANASSAFDDLQRLGDLDLALNFPNLSRSLYYPLNETSGATTMDWSGKGNTGYLVNGATWTTGVLSNALSMNGTTAYAYSPTVVGIPVGNARQTVSWWQYVAANPTTEMIAVCLKNSTAGTGLCAGYKSGLLGVWKMESGSWLLTTTPPTVGAWHHCAYTFDGTTHRLYLDGVEMSNSTFAPSTSAPQSVHLAAKGGWAGASNFAGNLDEVRIFQRALSPVEIQMIVRLSGN